MSFASWIKSVKGHAKRVPIRRRTFAPRLEGLEDRTVPTVVDPLLSTAPETPELVTTRSYVTLQPSERGFHFPGGCRESRA